MDYADGEEKWRDVWLDAGGLPWEHGIQSSGRGF